VDALIAMVNGFVTSGEITGQAEKGLLAKLETIKEKALKGETEAAANELGAFANEVQAQFGKKISNAAATALIAKAQELALEFSASIPVTGDATARPTDSMMGKLSDPVPMGNALKHQVQWDAVALQIMQSVGTSTFDYDLFQLPAKTAWDDTLAYYKTQAAAAGWGDAPSQTNEMQGGHYAIWSVTGDNGTTNFLIIAQVDNSDGTYTLNLVGNK
jgi:hypothetical protein